MRKQLIKECRKQGKPYGYYVKEVMGGFTYTSRYIPNVFNIIPLEVYRIYADEKPDELVRGVDFIERHWPCFLRLKPLAIQMPFSPDSAQPNREVFRLLLFHLPFMSEN